MLKRLVILITLFTLYTSVYANMSSPIHKGDITSEAYSSKDIDILHEHLLITFIDFYTVKFTVIYRIKSDREGKQIPMIFDTMTNRYAEDGSFSVWLDNQTIPVLRIPSTYENPNALQWIDSLDNNLRYPKEDVPNIIGLKYFETDLTKGEHTIHVEYTAQAEVDNWDLIKKFKIQYNLKPARYWRSFGSLDVEINTSNIKGIFETNISSDSILTSPVTHLHFTELPQDELIISYKPEISWLSKMLIKLTPEGLFLILSILLISFHIYFIIRYRIKNPNKRFSPVVIAGSIMAPFIYWVLYLISCSLTNLIIGKYASGRAEYIIFIFFFFLMLMPIYLVIVLIIDNIKKKRLQIKKDI